MDKEYDHNHYFKMFITKKEFVPDSESDNAADYIAIDYAYMYCPGCGETVKRIIKEVEDLG